MSARTLTVLAVGVDLCVPIVPDGPVDADTLDLIHDQLELRPDEPLDAIVVGPDVSNQVRSVQEMHLTHPDAAVVVVVAGEAGTTVRRALSYAPSVPADIEVIDAGDTRLFEAIRLAASHAAARRSHRSVLASVVRAPTAHHQPGVRSMPSLGTVLDHAPVGVLVCDSTGVLLSWNARAARLLQADSSSIDHPVAELFTRPGVVAATVAAAGTSGPDTATRLPVSVESAGDSAAFLEMTAVRTEMLDGQQVVLILLLDVSERRAAEIARDELDERLRLTQRSREFLFLASDILLSAKSYESMLERLAAAAVPILGDLCAIDLIEDGKLRRMITRHADPDEQALADLLGREHPGPGHPIFVAAHEGRTVWSSAMSDERLTGMVTGEQHVDILREIRASGYICVPLMVEGDVLGVVTVVSTDQREPFTGDDVDLAQQLADRLATIVAKTHRYDREHRIADELQRSMLTELPPSPGLEMTAHYLAAGTDADVGGDWYDAFELRNGDLAIVVGDVVGHDLKAVTKMGQLRNSLRSLAWHDGRDPGAVLDRLNELNTALRIATLATVIYGTLQHTPRGLMFCWANAGHPPPLLVSAAGATRYLDDAPSPVLGLTLPRERAAGRIRLDPGSTLYLYTDGLIERRRSTLEHGLDALATVAARHATDPLEQTCHAVIEQLGTDSEDDIALIAIRPSRSCREDVHT